MSLCDPCPVIDCPADDPFALYTLQEETFPFVLNCPPGYDCAPVPGSDISMVCCDDFMVTRTLPTALTQDIYTSILTGMIQECQTHQPFCGGQQVFSLYWNSPQSCTKYCPDGNPFTYTVPSGVVLAPTILQANQAAAARACSLAISKRICLGALNPVCCINEVFSAKITASGGGLAHSPSTNNWTISAGSLPTGLTFNGGDILGTFAIITGTPTVAGTYGFTVKVMAPDGQYQTKNYTLSVIQITPTTLPEAEVGIPYAQQLTATGIPPGKTAAFAVTSGILPTGLTLSAAGLVSGTPTGVNLPSTFNVTVTIT